MAKNRSKKRVIGGGEKEEKDENEGRRERKSERGKEREKVSGEKRERVRTMEWRERRKNAE